MEEDIVDFLHPIAFLFLPPGSLHPSKLSNDESLKADRCFHQVNYHHRLPPTVYSTIPSPHPFAPIRLPFYDISRRHTHVSVNRHAGRRLPELPAKLFAPFFSFFSSSFQKSLEKIDRWFWLWTFWMIYCISSPPFFFLSKPIFPSILYAVHIGAIHIYMQDIEYI